MDSTVASTAMTVIAVHGINPTASIFLRRPRLRSATLLTATTTAENTDIAIQKCSAKYNATRRMWCATG